MNGKVDGESVQFARLRSQDEGKRTFLELTSWNLLARDRV